MKDERQTLSSPYARARAWRSALARREVSVTTRSLVSSTLMKPEKRGFKIKHASTPLAENGVILTGARRHSSGAGQRLEEKA